MKHEINKIMNIMKSIEYGFKDPHGLNIISVDPQKWDNEFDKFYHLQTPKELLESKCGVCWDQVELERYLFSNYHLKVKTYFIFIKDNDNLPSHTFLTYEYDNKHYWFEHSWAKYQGIHGYINESDLLLDIQKKFIKEHNYVNQYSNLFIYEYQPPKNHITCNDFYKYIETQTLIKCTNIH